MQIKILIASFGFDEGATYNAVPDELGYIAQNGMYKGFIPHEEAEEV